MGDSRKRHSRCDRLWSVWWLLGFLCLLDVFLVVDVTLGQLRLQSLVDEEQEILESNFPPLSEERIEEILIQVFPDLTRFEKAIHGNTIKYQVNRDTSLIGYAYQVREDIFCPVCEDVRYFVGLGPEGTVLGIVLVNGFHLYGEPMSAIDQKRFLRQFSDKKIYDSTIAYEEINGITGATKTTQRFVDGLHNVRTIHREVNKGRR